MLPTTAEISAVNQSFGFYGRIILFALAVISIVAVLGGSWKLNQYALVEVPKKGGILTEGVIGTPRFINPVLATSDADRDLTALIYSGLMRISNDGSLEPDLAEKYTVSPDGRRYTFTLKKDSLWHDGKPVTAESVYGRTALLPLNSLCREHMPHFLKTRRLVYCLSTVGAE